MEKSTPGARRVHPSKLGALDLRTPDDRIVWATKAKASSEYSSSYRARDACGAPNVFPKGGDEYRTWLAENDDSRPWLDVELPAVERAAAIVVCETCGPGAVRKITDLDRDVVLFEEKPQKIQPSREAQLLYVPLGEHPPPQRLRLEVAPYSFGSEYKELDAVGLFTEPLDALRERAAEASGVTHMRLAPAAVHIHDLRKDERIHWAKRARASSEYSTDYSAKKAVGPPNVYPRGGDLENTWLCAGDGHDEWLELEFAHDGPVRGLIVLETCGAGAVYKITDEQDTLLWGARPETIPERQARLLHVPLDLPRAPKKVRVWVSSEVTDYREIDGVALLAAPLEALAEPAPPAGQPDDGWTALEGTLVGALPFVHAVLRTAKDGRAANGGGPVRLCLTDGAEVTLDTGRTAILGAPLTRARGRWSDVARELPWAAACFADAPPDADTRVVLEARRVDGDVNVEVLGEATEMRQQGGFRESGREVPERMVAAAIAVGSRGDFEKLGTDAFSRSARRFETLTPIRHPLRFLLIGLSIPAVLSGLGLIPYGADGGRFDDPLGPTLLSVFLFTGILALEHGARSAFIPAYVNGPGAGLHDRATVFRMNGIFLFVVGFLTMLGSLGVLGVVELTVGLEGAGLRIPLLVGAGLALVRLGYWLRVTARPLYTSLAVVLAREAPRTVGAKGRFSGRLGDGPFARFERTKVCAEHLGTTTSMDSRGQPVTHDSYRSWYERRISTHAPSQVRVALADGGVARVTGRPLTTDLGLVSRPTKEVQDVACFESLHEEGDPVTVVGVVEAVGEPIDVAATHLVLGRLSALRVRIAIHVAALIGLVGVVVFGLVVALVVI